MRIALLLPALALALGLGRVASADDAPPGAPAAPVPAPAAPPEEAPVAEPAPSGPVGPAQAWRDLQKSMSDPAKRTPNGMAEGAKAYLKDWEALKQEPKGEDIYWLGQFLAMAGRFEEAAARYEQAANCAELLDAQRALGAVAWSNQVAGKAREGTLKGAAAEAALATLAPWEGFVKGSQRMAVLNAKGQLLDAAGRLDEALETFALAGEANPEAASSMAGQIVRALLERCDDLAQLEPSRARLAPPLARLVEAQQQAVGRIRKALEAEADATKQAQIKVALKRVEAGLAQIAQSARPLEMLGAQAPAWTLVKAFGNGQSLADYQGKVVVMDFWATWCPWCIKSFPALRDLLKDYAGKDLVVVGVTTSSANVFDARYDLDDDLKSKAGGGPVKPTLVRPKPPAPLAPDADEAAKTAFAEAKAAHEKALGEFKAKEMEVLSTFIANHGMSWDVVMIDEKEPAPKYALTGWPHCVVIDRQGRIRHFKSGALLRDKPEAVAHFRKVLDRLLAESEPAAK